MKAVLFDADGTLIDSAPIITECMDELVLREQGIRRGADYYRRYVGPPLTDSFRELGAQDAAAWVEKYRELYTSRMMATPLFPGIATLLQNLHQAGVPMAVATSKATESARVLLEHLGVADAFVAICGSGQGPDLGTKADRINEALEALAKRGYSTAGAVMVGDRIFDIEGARAHDLPCILVRWGEGAPEEFDLAWQVVDSPAALEALLLQMEAVRSN